MIAAQESITAKLCSFARAYHSNTERKKIFDDYLAYDLMGKEEFEEIGQLIQNDFDFDNTAYDPGFETERIYSKLNRYIAPIPLSRIAFAEQKLAEFAGKHYKCQYVICGAGMDTFAFRNDDPGIRIFELDHPDTGRYKRERIRQLEWNIPENLSFVPIDFSKDDMTQVLLSAGYDPDIPTFFAILGVSYYLTLPVFEQTIKKIAELCRAHEAAFRDTRVFSFKKGEELKAISLTENSLVYVLGRDTNGLWRIDAPVAAPADQAMATALSEKILMLKQNDLTPQNAKEKKRSKIRVAVETTATSYPAIDVPAACFGDELSFADLRSKTLLTLDPGTVRRLSVRKEADEAPAVVYDTARAAWNLEKPVEGRRSNPDAIKALLTTLARVEAVSVETVAASPADFRRCGLDAPACVVIVDIETTGIARRNILLGGATSGGGRYATVGGVDAVFVISKQTAAALMADLTE